MKKFTFSVLALLIFAGCGNNSVDNELIIQLESKIEKLEKEKTEENNKKSFFEENQKCMKYKKQVNEDWQNGALAKDGEVNVTAIFFSPKENSCLYILKTVNQYVSSYSLMDVFTNKEIKQAVCSRKENCIISVFQKSEKWIEEYSK